MNFKVTLVVGAISFACWFGEGTSRKRSWICSEICKCSEIEDTFVVDCSNSGLESVPKGIPSRTTHLNLNNNKIKVVHNDSFVQNKEGELRNLTAVSIRSNRLKKIGINAFRGLHNLKILDLYNNSLKFMNSYPKSVFVPVRQSLEVLDIRRNLLGDISLMDYPVSVGELGGLRELRTDCLRNKSFPIEYGKMTKLTKISFSGGRKPVKLVGNDMFVAVSALGITDIDFAGLDIGIIGNNTFFQLQRLTTLDLSNNEHLSNRSIIDMIPALKKTSIETLKLNNTGMSQEATWGPILKKLSELHLKQLSLDNNSIANLTPMFSEYLPELELLSLGDNFIRDPMNLWNDFMKLKHLRGLNVSWQDKNTEEAASKTALKKPSTFGKMLSKGNNTKQKSGVICGKEMACPMIFPPKLEWIDISHNGVIARRLPELALVKNSTLKYIDASYNGIQIVEKPIYCAKMNLSSIVPKVETLNFNNNALQCVTAEFLSHCDWSSLKQTYFRSNKLGQGEGNICIKNKSRILGFLKPAINLEVLDLARNQIQNSEQLSDLESLTKLKEIDLSFNGFYNFSLALHNMTRLNKINLSNNNIHCLSASTVLDFNKLQNLKPENETIEVDLSGNLLSCTCQCFDFFPWMMGTQLHLKNLKTYECEFNDGTKETLNKLPFIVAKLESQCFGTRWLQWCFSVEIFTYFLITVACIAYRKRYSIKYIFLRMKLNRHKLRRILDTQNYTYSAFVSCDHRDAKFFLYRKFLPNLETPETKLKFCIAQRNFLVGATILDNIMRAINKSKKVIFIVSQYFLTSKWCQEELMIAHQVSLERGENVIICIFMPNVTPDQLPATLRMIVKTVTCLKWCPDPKVQRVFWLKLREGLDEVENDSSPYDIL